MEYIPKPPQQQPAPPPVYELTKDVTGKPPEHRGPFILKDRNGTSVRMPHKPKDNCKKCHGRGYVGMDARTGRIVVCHKCYQV
jgi:hypothetical protein